MGVRARLAIGAIGATAVVAGSLSGLVTAGPAAAAAPGPLTLVSVAADGSVPGGASYTEATDISADGRYVSFSTNAPLDPNDTSAKADTYLRDVVSGTTNLVSPGWPTGAPGVVSDHGAVSDDGKTGTFASTATFGTDSSSSMPSVLVTDMGLRSVTRAASSTSGAAKPTEFDNDVSGDGRYVLFRSLDTGFGPTDSNSAYDVYRLDRRDGLTDRLILGPGGVEPDESIDAFELSPDGRYLAFTTMASNLVAGDSGSSSDVFVEDLGTGTITRLTDGTAASLGAIASTGRTCLLTPSATLVPGGGNGKTQAVAVDLGGTRTLVSTPDGAAAPGDNYSFGCTISADGTVAAFGSTATNLVAGDTNAATDVFTRNLASATTSRVAATATLPVLAADGRTVAFTTAASLLPADTNGKTDVYRAPVPGAPANARPIAQVDEIRVVDGIVDQSDRNLLANDLDPDGDAKTAELVTQAAHGVAAVSSSGTVTYTPTGGYRGPDSFTYRAKDAGGTGPATTVRVDGVTLQLTPSSGPQLTVARREEGPRAVVSWGTFGNGPSQVRIQLRLLGSTFGTRTVTAPYPGSDQSVVIGNVTPDRYYEARMGAVFAEGTYWSPWSDPGAIDFNSRNLLASLMYLDLGLGGPSAATYTSWSNALNAGTQPSALTAQLLQSSGTAARYASVTRLFRAYFLRLPDTGGLDYWVKKQQAGTRLNTISQNFATSSEFKNRYGALSNTQFVDLVYQNVLGRPGDAGGRSYWIGKLNKGTSRGSMMVGFSESSEYVTKTRGITWSVAVWRTLLGRAPKATEHLYDKEIVKGGPLTVPITYVLATAEYGDRH